MTDTELRELDAWLAVNAMGWRRWTAKTRLDRYWYDTADNKFSVKQPWAVEAPPNLPAFGDATRWIPRYTRSISDAMAMLDEVCGKRRWGAMIERLAMHTPCRAAEWCVSICMGRSYTPNFEDSSLPLAICLAVRAAVEATKECA